MPVIFKSYVIKGESIDINWIFRLRAATAEYQIEKWITLLPESGTEPRTSCSAVPLATTLPTRQYFYYIHYIFAHNIYVSLQYNGIALKTHFVSTSHSNFSEIYFYGHNEKLGLASNQIQAR